MAHHQRKNLDDTYHAMKKFKKLLDQYNVVTKEHPLGEREKVWVNWSMLDKSTLAKAVMRPELRPKKRTFATITACVDELHIESLSNKLFSRVVGKGDAMDVGAVNVREPVGEEEEKFSAAEWASWWSEDAGQGQWQEIPHLDALGKGKGSKGGKGGKAWGKGAWRKGADTKGGGKGGGGATGYARPPLVCNRCLGTGELGSSCRHTNVRKDAGKERQAWRRQEDTRSSSNNKATRWPLQRQDSRCCRIGRLKGHGCRRQADRRLLTL